MAAPPGLLCCLLVAVWWLACSHCLPSQVLTGADAESRTVVTVTVFYLTYPVPTLPTQYLTYPGDIMLGGLFPIHKRAEPGQEDGAACGAIQDEDGIQVGTLVRIVNRAANKPSVKFSQSRSRPLLAWRLAFTFKTLLRTKLFNNRCSCKGVRVRLPVALVGAFSMIVKTSPMICLHL